ncbi:MAG: HD domain-containing protein [Candidatus Woesearchaeota archaeon]
MNNEEIISKTVDFVKNSLEHAEGGHDWWHVYRIWKLLKILAQKEGVENMLIIELGALLHDIADSKFHEGDEEVGPKIAREFLESLSLEEDIIYHIELIIKNISFKGGNHTQNFSSPELDIIQDADRLDALGAIGIARTFNYGGFKQRKLYDPNIKSNLNMTKEEYKKSTAPTINHFYEKLLLLKDKMNTQSGKQMAQRRHEFMEEYLEQFYQEWEGEL